MNARKLVAAGMLALAALAGCAEIETDAPVAAESPRLAVADDLRTPAPTTAAGYARMFAGLPTAQWGAADGAISVRTGDGRRLWIFSDTMSDGRFVRNSAVTQTAGELHVSHRGAQLIPNGPRRGGRHTIYWPESVKRVTSTAYDVRVAPVSVPNRSRDMWDFKRDPSRSRVARILLDAEGNATFLCWIGYVPWSESTFSHDGEDTRWNPRDEGHLSYQVQQHDVRVKGGWLVTVSNNRGDRWPTYAEYRPTFTVAGSAWLERRDGWIKF